MHKTQRPVVHHTCSSYSSVHRPDHCSALRVPPRRQGSRTRKPASTTVADAHQKPLVVVGSVNADMMLQVDRFPKPGETLSAKAMTTSAGGKVKSLQSIQSRPESLLQMRLLYYCTTDGL